MVSDTRSTRNSKDEGDGPSSKKKPDTRKDSSMQSPGKAQASGVRRSARETSNSRQKTPSPQRKSKRLEKGTPPSTPTLKRKSEILEQHISPSPVRRSDRGKKVFSPSSSSSKKSAKGHSLSESKKKKEKNLIEVTMESEKAELDLDSVGMKRKKMNARSFMRLFKRQRIKIVPDGDGALDGRDKLSDGCSDGSRGNDSEPKGNGEDINDECSRRIVRELRDESIDIDKASDGALQKSICSSKDCHEDIQNNGNMDSSFRDNVLDEPCSKSSHTSSSVRETVDCSERLPTNCSSTENMDAPESESSTCLAKTGGGSVCSIINEKCVRSKEATPSPSRKCENFDLLWTCVLCSKNKRIGYRSPEQELCSCNPTVEEDLGGFSSCKGRSDNEAVISETAEKRDSGHQLTEIRADSQVDGHENMCAVCNKRGELLCCEGKGCKRFYHLCCLDPPYALPGVWHCPQCVKKKLLFGVHSVSEGIESIWHVREVEVSNVKGVRQRQYLVKYNGLAHIHNHWVPEKQLLLENSCLVSSFIEKDQKVSWRTEWTMPHRLLRKRSIQDNIYIASSSAILVCNYEWLVKWHGLGYDHATWELDNAYCLRSHQGQNLMKDYETRCERAKQKANQNHKESIDNLSELSASQSLVNDNYMLKNVNKLRECVFKCQNAVVFDDEERAMTIALCLRSMSEICRPFLIVTASSSLSQWESEFARVVPSVDLVVYSGNTDTRKGIRASEFYDEGGHLMLQVLLSSVESVLEDLDRLVSIKWQAIVIDDHHQFGISNDHEEIKILPTNSRILLVTGQIKDTTSEYLKMLSLLESHGDLDKLRGLKSETNDHLCRLKDRLSRFIAYGNNSQISKFLEYWVPVQISKYQLEQYCATLLDNSVHLRSCSRNDRVGAVHDVLLTARKCCDHPYILDLSVQERLIADKRPAAEIFDIGIKASGKLELLDMMLKEIKARGLQALVLFQLINGSGGASIGNFLDDFLRQRFGPGTFERVEYSVNPSKKQAAVNRFNKKETGQFIFLLENRACSPTIKLPSLDVVVIYNSDWNPANDLRALQKLSIGSKVEQIKVFRLYSSFTVEERALVLAKQNLSLDNNLQNNFSRAASDNLLSWGAVHLFGKLDEYHDGSSSSDLNFSSGQLLLSEVTKEFQAILSENTDSNSVISKVKLGVGSYNTDIPMFGEAKVQLKDGEERHVFWKNLLDGKNYIWKHLRGPSPRNRKRIHNFEGSSSKITTQGDDAAKKRKKMVDDSLDPALVQVELGANQASQVTVSKEGPSTITACNQSQNLQKDGNTSNKKPNGMSEERIVSSFERKSLHSSMQTEMMRLCQVLKFSEDVTDIVLRFLEYVIKNRDVNSDSQSVVQALQISLCWIAASIKKQKIDKKDSLMLAKQLLNYQCTEEQACSVYFILEEMYLQSAEKIVNLDRQCMSAEEDISKEKVAASEVDYKIKKIQKLCSKRMKRLLRKHQAQLQELHRKWEEQRVKLERDHKVESAFIRSIHGEGSVRTDKLERLSHDLAVKMKDLDLQKEVELKDLEAKQLADCNEESRKAAQWLAETKPFSSGLGADNAPQSLGPQPQEHVVEGPQPNTPAEAIGCETRAENLATVDLQKEVAVKSLATAEHANQSKRSSENEETVLVHLPAFVEQVSDKIQSLGNDHEVVGHNDPVEESNASEKISDKGCGIASPVASVYQRCEPDEANGGELQSPRQPSVLAKQTTALSDCCDLSPQQVQQDKTDQIMTPAELQDFDELAVENQSILRIEAPVSNETVTPVSNHEAPVTDETVIPAKSNHEAPVTDETVTPIPSNHEALVTESSEKLHSVLVDRSLSWNQFSAIEDNDQGNSPQTAEPRGIEVLSHESIPQNGENLEKHNNHPNTRPVSSVAHEQSAELSAPSQTDVAIPQVVMGTAERPNQAGLQLGIDPSCLLLPTHQPTSGISHQISMLADPLQNELENLRREAEQLEKKHKEMASLLKSDCEKEIQEAIAQIRHKYEVKHQENEDEYKLKRNELDKNQKKVLMNKILAAVFRTKCADPRPYGVPAMQQGVPSVQQRHQLSMRPSIRPPPPGASACPPAPSVQTSQQLSWSHPVRSPSIANQNVANLPVRSPTTVIQNVANPPVRSPSIANQNVANPPVRSPTTVQNVANPPVRAPSIANQNVANTPVRPPTTVIQNVANPPVRSPTILNQNVATPPVQAVQNTAALFSGSPSRPPLISTITPSRNSRAGGEIRSAAPHLQSFRPSVAASVPLATSPSTPQLRPPLQSLQPLLPPLTNLVVPQNRASLQGGLSAPPNPSPSASGSVVGIDCRPFGPENRTSNLPEICSTFGSLELSDLEVLGNVQGNQKSSLVCLSDDE